jgi:hypothetical protein
MEDRDDIDPNKLALSFSNHTPDEKTEIKLEGDNFEIDVKEILSVLENTSQKYFGNIDYKFLNDSKNLLTHFFHNEKECILKIKEKDYPYYKKKFYKSLIYDSINEIFNQGPEKIIKEILDGLRKIRNIIDSKEKKNEVVTVESFNKLLEDTLGTSNVPKFLIRNDIKNIKFRQNYRNKEKKRPEEEKLIDYYKKIKNGNLRPFDYIINKNVLFSIFILSNGKDLLNDNLMSDILLNNYNEILSWFNLNSEMNNYKYDYVFENYIFITQEEKKNLIESFFIPINNELNAPNNNEDLHLIVFSSFFYCILHKMKDKNNQNNNDNLENNISNAKITKFLSNLIESFTFYLKNYKFNIKSLINALFVFANSSINKNGNEKETTKGGETDDGLFYYFPQEECRDYDFKIMEEIINNSGNNLLIERFNQVKSKFGNGLLELFYAPTSILDLVFKRVFNYFTQDIYSANYLRLSPFQKYMNYNTITIFVSGFGSQNDIHCVEWKKYIEYDQNSTYYFYHWPGYTFPKIIWASLPLTLTGIKFDTNLPKVFMDSIKKAKSSGKFLSLILRSRLFFGNRQINLVGYSLGCHVIKHCLKELSTGEDGKNLINDVTFMAGATTFKNKLNWHRILTKLVGGRIINCHSEVDYILKYLYRSCTDKIPIGMRSIDINDGINLRNIVENYDFTDLNLGHLNYRDKFDRILERINH